MAGDGATPERIEQIRQIMGLDQPVVKQFFIWAGKLVQGDLGTSLMSGVPVTQLIGQRLEPSLSLAVLTLVFTLIVAIPLGILAAWRQGSCWTAPSWAFPCSASRCRCSSPAIC